MRLMKIKDKLKVMRNAIHASLFLLKKKGLRVQLGKNVLIKGCIVRRNGERNSLTVEEGAIIRNCSFFLHGDNNRITIHKNARLIQTTFWVEDNNNLIEVGSGVSMEGPSQLAACEGTSIIIGDDCMFSSQVNLSTTDSHAILDLEGNRINPAKEIQIGNHVWIGQKTLVLKGSSVADNCIVGAYSLVNKKLTELNCIYAGHPAHKVKENISWNRER